jgi:excinuclease UvrABC helicase subunit UvrB
VKEFTFYPAKQFVTPKEKMAVAIREIRKELAERVEFFEKNQQYCLRPSASSSAPNTTSR